ncbi:unnamed protein product [Linum trigynum]|uniref:Uncharacterized protein n=1 Tax=Linum trigynum TaxID=586398 RepID=A0AAV2FJ84_9ROSI
MRELIIFHKKQENGRRKKERRIQKRCTREALIHAASGAAPANGMPFSACQPLCFPFSSLDHDVAASESE